MRYITKKQAATHLGPNRFTEFTRVHGARAAYTPASVLAFAGTLVRNRETGTYTILLPWQVAKQWAADRHETPPGHDVREYDEGNAAATEYHSSKRPTKYGENRAGMEARHKGGAAGILFEFRGEFVHEVAGLVNFRGEDPVAEETEWSEELERDVVLRSATTRPEATWA